MQLILSSLKGYEKVVGRYREFGKNPLGKGRRSRITLLVAS